MQSGIAGRASPDWALYVDDAFLTQLEVDVINEYADHPAETVEELITTENNGSQYAAALLKVLEKITDERVVKYTLKLVLDLLLYDVPSRVLLFKRSPGDETFDVSPFMRLVGNEDPEIRDLASELLSYFLASIPKPTEVLTQFVVHLKDVLDNDSSGGVVASRLPSAVTALSILLRNESIREMFIKRCGIHSLLALLRSPTLQSNMQLMYEILLCCWQLALNESSKREFNQVALHDIACVIRNEPKEKVKRMALATIRTVLTKSEQERQLSESLIDKGLLKLLESMDMKRVKDPEMVADIQWIHEVLTRNFRVLNTFEKHQAELRSGKLENGTVHTEKFWRENAKLFEANNFESLQILLQLLSSNDYVTVALALNDVGYFVQYYPNGKKIVQNFHGKSKIMVLLENENVEVQKQALLCCSKLMVTNWEFLQQAK